MADATEQWLGSGELNALVMKDGGLPDLEALIRATVETPGHMPIPIERDLHTVQERALASELRGAIRVGQAACETPGASLTGVTSRGGEADQSIKVQFSCSAGERCCQLGAVAAQRSLQERVAGAHAAAGMHPLEPFRYFGG